MYNQALVLKLQELIFPVVAWSLIILGMLLFFLLAVYIMSIALHYRTQKRINRFRPRWLDQLNDLLLGKTTPDRLKLTLADRPFFKELLLDEFTCRTLTDQDKIKSVYQSLGLLQEDKRKLKSPFWWQRAGAVERLMILKFAEAEPAVWPLLDDQRTEVRFAAIRMLVAVNSHYLGKRLMDIFSHSSRWTYRYLVNKLYGMAVPVKYLKPLAESDNRDLRKAGAILLGQPGNHEAIPLLGRLIKDNIKDVRREAVLALGRVKTPSVLQILKDSCRDPNPQVRAAAVRALSGFKDPDSLALLERLVDDDDFDVKLQAFFALKQQGPAGLAVIEKHRHAYPVIAGEFLS